jgi:hypothetical protein
LREPESPKVRAVEVPEPSLCESSELPARESTEVSLWTSSEAFECDVLDGCVVVTTLRRCLVVSEPPLSSPVLGLGAVVVVTGARVTVVVGRAVSWAVTVVEVVDEVSPSPAAPTVEDSSLASPPSMIFGTDFTIAVAGSVG